MKISIQSIVAASTLVLVSFLVGCGGAGVATPGETDTLKLLKEIQTAQKADQAIIAAQQKTIEDMKQKQVIGQVNATNLGRGVNTSDMPAILNNGEQQMNYVNIQAAGKHALNALFGVREVQAHICVISPTLIQPAAPVFIHPQPAQCQQPIFVAPVRPVPALHR